MNIWDSREKEIVILERPLPTPVKRYRRATWTIYTDRKDWRIGVRFNRKYGDAEINLPMIQFVREGWYAQESK